MSVMSNIQTELDLNWYESGDSLVHNSGEFTIVVSGYPLDLSADGGLWSTVTGQLIAGGTVGSLLEDMDYLLSLAVWDCLDCGASGGGAPGVLETTVEHVCWDV